VQGIDGGADDYVAKPFRMEELLARIRALIRRASGLAQSELRCGALAVDVRNARVSVGGHPVKLTSHEFRVLSYLMHHHGRVVSRAELTDHWPDIGQQIAQNLNQPSARSATPTIQSQNPCPTPFNHAVDEISIC
jgi:DNA-binding response OmpR family regulator